ncbi:PH domain-containing protein [Prochlorococcus marinus]|uniref:PH domain-containing protein n=1 Tax=Prochlorococcus marinus TaxID=1219 RepID=UPI0022B35A80|nr:PH domain-containing protein [Prochlorococcus marinus]
MINSSEKIFFEGAPAKEDLILNILAGFTLIGLPFTVGAIVRAMWLRFKITNKRISVTGGWLGKDKSQISYSQIKEVRSIPRGLGTYGDMVLVMNDNARLEMRSIPKFREVEDFIKSQINQISSRKSSDDVVGF